MDAQRLIEALDRFTGVLQVAVGVIDPSDAPWRPPGGAWSVLEVVRHLADEEVEDFRCRLQLTLRNPEHPWPPIDPEGWAVMRDYNDGDLQEALQRFSSEREASVSWLRSLHRPDWSATHDHPVGPIRAGDLLASWVAHDALHLRQIAKRMFQLADRDSGDYEAKYAGSWTA